MSEKLRSALVIIAIVLLMALYLVLNHNQTDYPERYYASPVVSTDYPNIDMNIEQVVDDGSYIYVLHHHSNGIVQVYDLDGNYQHTLFFYCHMNGGFSLAVEDNILYVQDMRQNVYVFREGEFCDFLTKREAEIELSNVRFRSGESSDGYTIRSQSVWKEINGEPVLIIGTPDQDKVLDTTGLLMLGCVVILAIMIRKRRRTGDGFA